MKAGRAGTGAGRRIGRTAGAVGACYLAGFALAQAAPAGGGGLQSDVVFSAYSPLSSNAELARRMLSPLAAAQIPLLLARSGKALREQPVDLSQERFAVYAPAKAPSGGYGLMVFVPPWPQAKLPPAWASVLDRYGFIFVSAARSGNEATDLGRRAPLALLAAETIRRRYRVDPERIYIAGFSGGSRVAVRLALAYPDLFRGALLSGGSDTIGDGQFAAPPKELLFRFQASTRLVYVTGELDLAGLAADAASLRSMRAWCQFHVDDEIMAGVGHAVPDARALSRALDALLQPVEPDTPRLTDCRSAMAGKLAAKLDQVNSLFSSGDRAAARNLLMDIDKRFGGLAAPRSVDLDRELSDPRV